MPDEFNGINKLSEKIAIKQQKLPERPLKAGFLIN
jgi:hypothetical protein